MTVTRRRGEPAAPGAAVTADAGPPGAEAVPHLGDSPPLPPPAHFLLDAGTADLLLGAALRDLATKVARRRWLVLLCRPSEPKAEILRLH